MHPSDKYSRANRGPLVPCPSCKRHVFAIEDGCPFCAAPLPIDLSSKAAPAAPQRLSRAELFAFNDPRRGKRVRELDSADLAHATGGLSLGGLGQAQDDGSGFQMYGAPSLGEQLSSPSFGSNEAPSVWDDPGGGFQMYGAPATDDPFQDPTVDPGFGDESS